MKINFENEFMDIDTLEEAKKVFKKLAKKLHPDLGGCVEEFKELNNFYHSFIENGFNFFDNFSSEDFSIEVEKIVSQILHFENLIIEVIGSWIWVKGDTMPIKEDLKEIGFKWARNKKMWYFGKRSKGSRGKEHDINDIRSKYGSTSINTKSNQKIAI